MDDEAEWEIMPHKTIEKIKSELDDLKVRAASKDTISNESLRKSIDSLTYSVNNLMGLFKEATEELKIEEKTKDDMKNQMGPLMRRIESLEMENRKIAQGILAVADMIQQKMPDKIEISTGAPKQKETIRRTYTEQLVPKENIPDLTLPGSSKLSPENPMRTITAVEQREGFGQQQQPGQLRSNEPQAQRNMGMNMNIQQITPFSQEEDSSSFELPPLERPVMPQSFDRNNAPISRPRPQIMPAQPQFQNYPRQPMPPMGGQQGGMNFPQPMSQGMPPPPGAAGGFPLPPPPPPKAKGGFLGGMFGK